MEKDNKRRKYIKLISGIIIGILLSATGVYAVTTIGNGSDITYSNTDSKLSSTTAQDALDEIYALGRRCPDDHTCFKKKNTLALGDYVKMTPTKSSYTTSTSKTGYTSSQTINPQELNLWRVISKNSDGTVDIISEHISSTSIYFNGKKGYQNFVGYLNVLASQYANSTYTTGSRYFGYNGQTEYITDISKFTNPAPWKCSTGKSCNPVEKQGGGDTKYTKDYNLVNRILGLDASKVNNGKTADYWIASRYYVYNSSSEYYWLGRSKNILDASGSLPSFYRYSHTYFLSYSRAKYLRPILTLKSGLKYSGLGTETYPMEISTS